jgi:hypothetical protein
MRKKRFKSLAGIIRKIIEKENLTTLKICDMGGTFVYWKFFPFDEFKDITIEITLFNLGDKHKAPLKELPNNVKQISRQGNACNLIDVKDDEFDLCHSNSVIEHVGGWDNIKLMRNETKRVAKYYYMQTPNFWFPYEPHYVLPLIQYFPRPIYVKYLRWQKKISFDLATEKFERNRMLTKKEILYLFPDSKMIKEKFLFTKSYTMVSPSLYP